MTVIRKDYSCTCVNNDILTVHIYTNDNDQDSTSRFTMEDCEVVLNVKQIRRLIRQLKKALPEKAKQPKDEAFSREDVHGNIHVGDTVVIHLPGAAASDRAEGTVIEVDDTDPLMPLRLQLVGGIRSWILFDEQTRVFKLK